MLRNITTTFLNDNQGDNSKIFLARTKVPNSEDKPLPKRPSPYRQNQQVLQEVQEMYEFKPKKPGATLSSVTEEDEENEINGDSHLIRSNRP